MSAESGLGPRVTVDTFVRAESDTYFRGLIEEAGIGVLRHIRAPAPVTNQSVIRMNRDTLYSSGVFDFDAAPVTITVPEHGSRYLSILPVNQDHFTSDCVYGPGVHAFTRDQLGTRYGALIIRTFVDSRSPDDVAEVNRLQDAIVVETGVQSAEFDAPDWDLDSLKTVRDTLLAVAPAMQYLPGASFGTAQEVNPIRHLLGTAGGWGGNPPRDASYKAVFPLRDDGRTSYALRLSEVPVDGFWSVSVYNRGGYFEPNPYDRYSVNDVTADRDPDGAITVHFGGPDNAPNFLPIADGWNLVLRLYRPRAEILDGSWEMPELQQAG